MEMKRKIDTQEKKKTFASVGIGVSKENWLHCLYTKDFDEVDKKYK